MTIDPLFIPCCYTVLGACIITLSVRRIRSSPPVCRDRFHGEPTQSTTTHRE
jgi:hypothetical protein